MRPWAIARPSEQTRGGSRDGEDERLQEHGARNLAASGPERAQHPELAGALQHGHREAVEDQEAADEQRHAAEEQEHDVEGLQLLGDVVGHLRGRLHVRARSERALQARLHALDVVRGRDTRTLIDA